MSTTSSTSDSSSSSSGSVRGVAISASNKQPLQMDFPPISTVPLFNFGNPPAPAPQSSSSTDPFLRMLAGSSSPPPPLVSQLDDAMADLTLGSSNSGVSSNTNPFAMQPSSSNRISNRQPVMRTVRSSSQTRPVNSRSTVARSGQELLQRLGLTDSSNNSNNNNNSSSSGSSSSSSSQSSAVKHRMTRPSTDLLNTGFGVVSTPMFVTTANNSDKAGSFNTVPVRRCPIPAEEADPFAYLPSIMMRTVKSLPLGSSVVLLQDPLSSQPLVLQCQCNQWMCQYRLHCTCTNHNCPWPKLIHDGYLPRYGSFPPVDSELHPDRALDNQ